MAKFTNGPAPQQAAFDTLNSKFAKNTVTLTDVNVAQYAAVNVNLTSPGTGFVPVGYSFNTIYSWHEAMLSVYVSTTGPKLRIMSLDSGTNLYSGVIEVYWVKF